MQGSRVRNENSVQKLTLKLMFQIHWLFSLLSLHHAFVTGSNRLVGVVSLTEVISLLIYYFSLLFVSVLLCRIANIKVWHVVDLSEIKFNLFFNRERFTDSA